MTRPFTALLMPFLAIALTQQPAPKGSTTKSGEVPTTDISHPLDSFNYDKPANNPANQTKPLCNADQLDVRVGTEHTSNSHRGIPVSFKSHANAPCIVGPGLDLRLENKQQTSVRDPQTNKLVRSYTYRPIAVRPCQNCGNFQFGPSTGQDVTLNPGDYIYLIVGSTTSSPSCFGIDAVGWRTRLDEQPIHKDAGFQVCTPVSISGVLTRLPDAFDVP